SRSGGVLDMATDMGIVTKAGTWYTYGEMRLGQGRENAKEFLEERPELMEELAAKVRGENKEQVPTPEEV
ncbi:MAG: recombinase RecA, partial [Armatimonadota bacterium]